MQGAKKCKRREQSPDLETTKVGRSLCNKLRFIAKHRGLTADQAWDQFAGPSIDAEFKRCVGEVESPKPARRA